MFLSFRNFGNRTLLLASIAMPFVFTDGFCAVIFGFTNIKWIAMPFVFSDGFCALILGFINIKLKKKMRKGYLNLDLSVVITMCLVSITTACML